MKTKFSILREAMAAGEWEKALSIANKFPRLGAHKDAITRAHAAVTNPHFFVQIGKDPELLRQIGIQALIARYYRVE